MGKINNIDSGKDCLDMTPKVQAKIDKRDKPAFIKIENFHASKGTVERVKVESTEWEKILTNPVSDQELIFRIYKVLLQQKGKRPIQKWQSI